MKKVYLHVGSHKTGTTSIQKSCRLNKELLKQQGVDYFTKGRGGVELSQRFLGHWLNKGKVITPHESNVTIEDLDELVSLIEQTDCEKVIISDENLSWIFDEAEIEKISQKFKSSFDFYVVFYIRRQDELAISHLAEAAKHGGGGGHARSHYLTCGKSLPMKNGDSYYYRYLDFYRKINAWASHTGIQNVIVRVFNKNTLLNGDVVDDFYSSIGVDSSSFARFQDSNVSMGFERTKVGHLLHHSEEVGNKLPVGVKAAILKSTNNSGKLLPSRAEASEFYSCYQQSNIDLNRQMNIFDGSEDVFDMDFSKYPEIEQDTWDEDSANSAIVNLILGLSKKSREIDLLRDCAIALESVDMHKALQLMELARKARPHGVFINQKLAEYKATLIDDEPPIPTVERSNSSLCQPIKNE